MDVVGALEYEYVGEELAREKEDEEAKRAEQAGAAGVSGGENADAGAAQNEERTKSGAEATTDAGEDTGELEKAMSMQPRPPLHLDSHQAPQRATGGTNDKKPK